MVYRNTIVLVVLLAGVCNGLSRERFRRALGVNTPKFAALRPGVQLLDHHINGAEEGMDGGGDLNWTVECPETFEIYLYMNASGCLGDGTPLGDDFNDETAAQLIIPEYCHHCNATDILDMVLALDDSCFVDSQVLPSLAQILPILAAMCTQNDAGEFCVADFFIAMILDGDGDERSSDTYTPDSTEYGNSAPGPAPGPAPSEGPAPGPAPSEGPAPGPAPSNGPSPAGPSPVDIRLLQESPAPGQGPAPSPNSPQDPAPGPAPHPSSPPGAAPGPGPAPGPEYEYDDEVFWWDALCDVDDDCPWKERLLEHQFDCNPDVFIFTTLCVQDQDRYCVETVSEFLESGDYYDPPTQYDHERFCADPCAGAVIEDMHAAHFPRCLNDHDLPIDLALACYQKNGTYCMPTLAEHMNELECEFGDPADIANWPCDQVCSESIDAMFAEFGCCMEVYFELGFGAENVALIYDWIDGQCPGGLPDAALANNDCSEEYAPPRDTPECRQLREYGFDGLGTLKCMVEFHESP